MTTIETIYYNEKGFPETVVYIRDNEPNVYKTWQFSYTYSGDSLVTGLVWSVQDYGETEILTESVDFTEYGGYLYDTLYNELQDRIVLSIGNANNTHIDEYHLSYSTHFGNFYMRKDSEETIAYDSAGKIVSETRYYPRSERKITEHYSYDNQGNLIEIRSNANENTDSQLYLTTYTYGYIYTPDTN